MVKKKILIISRIIHPAQNPRAYRATELAKELARQGHNVLLYAVLGSFDYTSFKSEYKLNVRNIGKMLFATYNSDERIRNNIFDKILNKLLKRIIEYPDLEFMFKIHRIFSLEKNADLVISVAAPFPIHWGCALSKCLNRKSFPKIWIADCGDPFMGNHFKKHPFYFKYLEKWFCREADYITVPFEGAKEGYYDEFRKKIHVIPQGFRFDKIKLSSERNPNTKTTFAYAGAFYPEIRDPSEFLKFLTTLNKDFRFIVYTRNDEFLNPYLKLLGGKIEIRNYVQRTELLYELSSMDFVVNFENNTKIHSPSKLIDYSLVKRPILNIPANLLPIKTIHEFMEGDYHNQFIVNNIEQYDITNVANQFIALL